jgi:hypothetical protein
LMGRFGHNQPTVPGRNPAPAGLVTGRPRPGLEIQCGLTGGSSGLRATIPSIIESLSLPRSSPGEPPVPATVTAGRGPSSRYLSQSSFIRAGLQGFNKVLSQVQFSVAARPGRAGPGRPVRPVVAGTPSRTPPGPAAAGQLPKSCETDGDVTTAWDSDRGTVTVTVTVTVTG